MTKSPRREIFPARGPMFSTKPLPLDAALYLRPYRTILPQDCQEKKAGLRSAIARGQACQSHATPVITHKAAWSDPRISESNRAEPGESESFPLYTWPLGLRVAGECVEVLDGVGWANPDSPFASTTSRLGATMLANGASFSRERQHENCEGLCEYGEKSEDCFRAEAGHKREIRENVRGRHAFQAAEKRVSP